MSYGCQTCLHAEVSPAAEPCLDCTGVEGPGLRWQPMAAPTSATGIEALVIADIERRQRLGIAKYGTTVAANPLDLRAWLNHALEEALDMAVYLKRAIAELE